MERVGSRERLVQAMSDLLWERGYAATTPREVRDRAQVGQGSMYYHFPTKRDLGLAAITQNAAAVERSSTDDLNGSDSALDRVRAHLLRPREALKGCKIGRLTQDPVVAGDPELLEPVGKAFAEIHEDLRRTLQEAIDAGTLPDGLDADQTAYLCSATIQGGYVLSIAAQDRTPMDQACAGLLTLLDALETAPAPPSSSTSPTHEPPGLTEPGTPAATHSAA